MLSEDEIPKPEYDIRKIKTVEKDIRKSINLEKLTNQPIEKLYHILEELIGYKNAAASISVDSEVTDSILNNNSSGVTRHHQGLGGGSINGRKGLLRMNSLEISNLYKDHFKYEFAENELYKLLGEHADT